MTSSDGSPGFEVGEDPDVLQPRPRPDQGELLRGGPERVYEVISGGDPLHLAGLCSSELLEAAYLLDVERLYGKCRARIAACAEEYDAEQDLESWLRARIREVIDLLVDADREELRSDHQMDPWDPRYEFLIQTLGLEPGMTLQASVNFNNLSEPYRRAFLSVVMEERRIPDCVAAGMGTQQEIVDRTRTAFKALYCILPESHPAIETVAEGDNHE